MLWFNLSLLSAVSKDANQAVTKTLISDFSILQGGPVAYVIAIKRLRILMTSLVGMLVYGEIFSMWRLSEAALIVGGAAVIYVS